MPRTMRAVLIGANRALGGFTKIPAALDAVHVASRFLADRFGTAGKLVAPSKLLALTGTKPTKAAVDGALAKAAKDSAAGDLFVMLFSGHGGNPKTEQYFQLHDQSFTDSDLANAINAFDPAVEVVVVADCCHAAKLFDPGPMIHPGHPGHPISGVPAIPTVPGLGPTERLEKFRLGLRSWSTLRRTSVLKKIAQPANFVLAASASGIQVHANGQSEFVRTLIDAVRPAGRYKDLLDEMKNLVPVPEEQADWSVKGRPDPLFERPPFKKT
jgi:hypothetical protein